MSGTGTDLIFVHTEEVNCKMVESVPVLVDISTQKLTQRRSRKILLIFRCTCYSPIICTCEDSDSISDEMLEVFLSNNQGWLGKTQPGLTHRVKTGLNHTEKPTKVGKNWVLLTFL